MKACGDCPFEKRMWMREKRSRRRGGQWRVGKPSVGFAPRLDAARIFAWAVLGIRQFDAEPHHAQPDDRAPPSHSISQVRMEDLIGSGSSWPPSYSMNAVSAPLRPLR